MSIDNQAQSKFQFNLSSLFIVTTVVAIVCAALACNDFGVWFIASIVLSTIGLLYRRLGSNELLANSIIFPSLMGVLLLGLLWVIMAIIFPRGPGV